MMQHLRKSHSVFFLCFPCLNVGIDPPIVRDGSHFSGAITSDAANGWRHLATRTTPGANEEPLVTPHVCGMA
jgi:hypothetical protein